MTTDQQVENFKKEQIKVEISHHMAMAVVSEEVKQELIKDLTSD